MQPVFLSLQPMSSTCAPLSDQPVFPLSTQPVFPCPQPVSHLLSLCSCLFLCSRLLSLCSSVSACVPVSSACVPVSACDPVSSSCVPLSPQCVFLSDQPVLFSTATLRYSKGLKSLVCN
uniref:Uncharacterized protein n=1 Tax=Anguilla anguilla TaxID=7936 RepID=A0A0E9XIY4_ANGAN